LRIFRSIVAAQFAQVMPVIGKVVLFTSVMDYLVAEVKNLQLSLCRTAANGQPGV